VPFEIIWSDSAVRELKKLDRSVAKRIFNAVSRLKEDSFRAVSKIVNSQYYKLRVGDYQIILDIQRGELRILVLIVGHRKKIYKKK
jgi:mRNA interferase RelE/StbE